MILNGLSFYMKWKNSDWKEILRKSTVPFIIAVVLTGILIALQIDEVGLAILAFAAIFSIIINSQVLFRMMRKTPNKIGSMLSHIGIAILLIGVIFSGAYSEKEAHSLKLNESTNSFGYKVTYLGKKQIEKELMDREKYEHKLLFEKNGSKTEVNSILYWSDFNDREQVFLEPGITTEITKDIYVSPVSYDQKMNLPEISLAKNMEVIYDNDTTIHLTLEGFDMSGGEKNSKDEILFGAVVKFKVRNFDYTDTIYTWLDMNSFSGTPVWYKIDSTNYEIGFSGLKRGMESADESMALMLMKESGDKLPENTDVFTFQVELKPYMYLVWIGSVFIVAGLFIAITKYRKKAITTV
jgi:cytochrome c biogenesis factor